MAGIYLDDELADSTIMDDPHLAWLWLTCLLRASRSNPRGEFSFSYRTWAENLGVKKWKLEAEIKRLVDMGRITTKAGREKTAISVCDWPRYEIGASVVSDASADTKRTSRKASPIVKESTTEKRFTPPEAGEVMFYAHELGEVIDGEAFVDFYASKGWMVGSNRMKDWKAAVRTWVKRQRHGGGRTSGRSPSDPRGNMATLQRVLGGMDDEAA